MARGGRRVRSRGVGLRLGFVSPGGVGGCGVAYGVGYFVLGLLGLLWLLGFPEDVMNGVKNDER